MDRAGVAQAVWESAAVADALPATSPSLLTHTHTHNIYVSQLIEASSWASHMDQYKRTVTPFFFLRLTFGLEQLTRVLHVQTDRHAASSLFSAALAFTLLSEMSGWQGVVRGSSGEQ